MARFYKASKATFVDDIIYQAPHELKKQALASQEKAFETQRALMDDFTTDLEHIDKDDELVSGLLNNHQATADEITGQMYSNPALFDAYMPIARKAKVDFQRDVTSGSIFKADVEKKKKDAFEAQVQKDLDSKVINVDAAEAAKLKAYEDYKGVEESEYAPVGILRRVDSDQFAKDLRATIMADKTATASSRPDGEAYIISTAGTKSYITKAKMDTIMDNDPTFQAFKDERKETYERLLQYGSTFGNREQMEAKLKHDIDAFRKSTIEKIIYNQETKEAHTTADSAFLTMSAWNREDKELLAESTESLESESIDSENLVSLYSKDDPTLYTVDASGKKTIKDEKTLNNQIETERRTLRTKLGKVGLEFEDFLSKMKSYSGALDIAKKTGLDMNTLIRQANYDRNTNLYRPTVEGYNENRENPVYQMKQIAATKEIAAAMNQFPPTQEFEMDIVTGSGHKKTVNMSISEAISAGYIIPPTKETTTSELIRDATGAYLDTEGDAHVWSIADAKAGLGKKGDPIPLATLQKNGATLKKQKIVDTEQDFQSNILDVKPTEVRAQNHTVYTKGGTAVNKTYFVAKRQFKNADGTLGTVLIKMPKSFKSKGLSVIY